MTNSHPAPSYIRDDSICESSLNPNKSSGDIVELKPCPFCGGEPIWRGEDSPGIWVACDRCAASTSDFGSQKMAAKYWNTRNPDPESAAEIERLRRENEQLNFTFNLQWEADQRAIKAWQATHPGKERTWPDRCCMVIWLIEELATAESAVAAAWEEAERVVRAMARNFKGQVYEAALNKAADNIRASAIRAAVSKKTAEGGHSPSTHDSESE